MKQSDKQKIISALLDAFEEIGEEPPEIQDPVESVPPERMYVDGLDQFEEWGDDPLNY